MNDKTKPIYKNVMQCGICGALLTELVDRQKSMAATIHLVGTSNVKQIPAT